MNILVLNGSPRPTGNTAATVTAFAEGARENGGNEWLEAVDDGLYRKLR